MHRVEAAARVQRIFFARARGFRGEDDVLVTTRREDGVALFGVVNAYDCGFATCFPDGSRVLAASLRDRFLCGEAPDANVQGALQDFFGACPHSGDDLDDYAASFALAWAGKHEITLAAIGGEVVRVYRGEAVVAQFPEESRRWIARLLPALRMVAGVADRRSTCPIAWGTVPRADADRLDLLDLSLDKALGSQPIPASGADERITRTAATVGHLAGLRVDLVGDAVPKYG